MVKKTTKKKVAKKVAVKKVEPVVEPVVESVAEVVPLKPEEWSDVDVEPVVDAELSALDSQYAGLKKDSGYHSAKRKLRGWQ